MKQLDPKAVWLFFWSAIPRFIFMVLILFFYVGIPLVSLFADLLGGGAGFLAVVIGLIVALALFSVLAFVWAKLSYRFYKYELTENGFRKESGVIYKKYTTIPYERIQNVDIYRGILARILGLSDLQIQTAGASATVSRFGAAGMGSEGRLPGLSVVDAEQLRDELIKRAKSGRQGL